MCSQFFPTNSYRCTSASSPSHSPRLTRRAATSPGALQVPSRPPAIDNSPLVEANTAKASLCVCVCVRLLTQKRCKSTTLCCFLYPILRVCRVCGIRMSMDNFCDSALPSFQFMIEYSNQYH